MESETHNLLDETQWKLHPQGYYQVRGEDCEGGVFVFQRLDFPDLAVYAWMTCQSRAETVGQGYLYERFADFYSAAETSLKDILTQYAHFMGFPASPPVHCSRTDHSEASHFSCQLILKTISVTFRVASQRNSN